MKVKEILREIIANSLLTKCWNWSKDKTHESTEDICQFLSRRK